MATIEKRNNAYRITVCCGYDINGKQIRRRMTYTPDEKMTAKQIEKEVQRQAVLFEEQCNNGTVGTDGRMKLADFVPIYLENASTGSPLLCMKSIAICSTSALSQCSDISN